MAAGHHHLQREIHVYIMVEIENNMIVNKWDIEKNRLIGGE